MEKTHKSRIIDTMPAVKDIFACAGHLSAYTMNAVPEFIGIEVNMTQLAQAKLPVGYLPSAKEEYMNPMQVEYFRQKLLAWKEELYVESHETVEHLREEKDAEPDINDRATVELETAFELRTRDRYRKLIEKIDGALRRIEQGAYGYCEETGEPIGLKRLEARPIATLCIEAQERHESFERQHNEED
jgi:DnaK suppressor protein